MKLRIFITTSIRAGRIKKNIIIFSRNCSQPKQSFAFKFIVFIKLILIEMQLHLNLEIDHVANLNYVCFSN